MTNTQQHYEYMTKTPVAKLILRLGIPTTVAMLITSIYNLADTYFVGALGESQQGAIGILFTLQSILQAFAYMLGHGSGTFVAKELANKNKDQASKYVSTAFILGGIIGLVFTVLGLALLTPLMKLLGATDTILPYAKEYGACVLASAPFFICSLILNNNLRYEGKSFYAMIGIGSGGLLNIFGDWLLVKVVGMGVLGAGVATAVSQTFSCIFLFVLFWKNAQSKISFKFFAAEKVLIFGVIKNGFPSLIRQLLNSVSGGVLNHLAKYYGAATGNADAVIDAMSIVNRVSNFVMCVGMGISQGLQPVASFNYQAKEYSRVKQSLQMAIPICLGCVALLAVPSFIFADQIALVFQDKAGVQEIAAPAIRYAMIGMMFMPLFVPVNMLYQSIRKPTIASFLALLRSGVVFIPMIFLLTWQLQITGLQLAQPVADVITALINLPFVIHFLKTTPQNDGKENDSVNQSVEGELQQ